MESDIMEPNAFICLECKHIEMLNKYKDGQCCPKCGGHEVPCYIGIDLSSKDSINSL